MTTETLTTETTTTEAQASDPTTTASVPTLTVGSRKFFLPFQNLLPPQSADERARLFADIKDNGILVPILVTEDGEVLDGHHRLAIAAELGLSEIPVEVKRGLTAEQKRQCAEELNLNRRHLSREQVQGIIAARLAADSQQSDRSLAEKLGTCHRTVGRARAKLAASGALPQSGTTRGGDGRIRRRPAAKKKTAAAVKPAKKKTARLGKAAEGATPERTAGSATATATSTPTAAAAPTEEPPAYVRRGWKEALVGAGQVAYGLEMSAYRVAKMRQAERDGGAVRSLAEQARSLADGLDAIAAAQDARNADPANTEE